MKKYLAEMVGTLVLTLMGCGAAVALGCDPVSNIPATVGTAVAFGLSVVAMAYTIGGISGCHINPAITLGVLLSGRMTVKDAVGYWIGQIVGGILGAAVLYLLTSSTGTIDGTGANDLQQGITPLAGFLAETVFTCVFVLVVLGATAKTNGATNNFAGLAIGLALILVHLACIRFTGTSVNPARSIGPALFQGGSALSNLWIFIIAPLIGGALASLIWKAIEPCAKE